MDDLRARMAEIQASANGAQADGECEVPSHSFNDDKLVKIVKSVGGQEFSVKKCGSIYYEAHGMKLTLTRLSDGDLLMTYAATGCEWTLEQINDWNRTKRLSRAYIDADGDPVLEADLISDTGLSVDQVQVFIDVFHASAHSYSQLLAEYCGA